MTMSIAMEKGWSETEGPTCAACANPIRARGEKDVAVLAGEILECRTPEGTWYAHFRCRARDWWLAVPDEKLWYVRHLAERTYVLLTDRPEWARKNPEVAYHKRSG